MDEPKSFQETILKETPRMGPDDRFTFHCGSDLPCFTRCCGDVNIVLTPYDVLRLKRSLRMDSTEFLEKHTILPFTKEQKIPVVLLKMDPQTKRCLLLGEQGCGVYKDRPWACRMYPLGLASPRNPNPDDHAFYFLLKEEQCEGVGTGGEMTVREWIRDQGIEEYDANSASFQSLMLHEFWDKSEALPPEKIEMYHMACYDLDRFRRFVFESSFLQRFEVDEARVEAMRGDDEELLDFAMQWLRYVLFGERTMRPRPEAVEAAKGKQD
jgi:hypothetical protein